MMNNVGGYAHWWGPVVKDENLNKYYSLLDKLGFNREDENVMLHPGINHKNKLSLTRCSSFPLPIY
jgi:hypothetical protein